MKVDLQIVDFIKFVFIGIDHLGVDLTQVDLMCEHSGFISIQILHTTLSQRVNFHTLFKCTHPCVPMLLSVYKFCLPPCHEE